MKKIPRLLNYIPVRHHVNALASFSRWGLFGDFINILNIPLHPHKALRWKTFKFNWRIVYSNFMENPDSRDKELSRMGMAKCIHENQPHEQKVCNFIISLTDSHAMDLYQEIYFPLPLLERYADAPATSNIQ